MRFKRGRVPSLQAISRANEGELYFVSNLNSSAAGTTPSCSTRSRDPSGRLIMRRLVLLRERFERNLDESNYLEFRGRAFDECIRRCIRRVGGVYFENKWRIETGARLLPSFRSFWFVHFLCHVSLLGIRWRFLVESDITIIICTELKINGEIFRFFRNPNFHKIC